MTTIFTYGFILLFGSLIPILHFFNLRKWLKIYCLHILNVFKLMEEESLMVEYLLLFFFNMAFSEEFLILIHLNRISWLNASTITLLRWVCVISCNNLVYIVNFRLKLFLLLFFWLIDVPWSCLSIHLHVKGSLVNILIIIFLKHLVAFVFHI